MSTKADLQARITLVKKSLLRLIKDNLGAPNPEVRDVVSELIETVAVLEGKAIHEV